MRSQRGELLSAACALALLVLMFAFAWYGVDGIPGRPAAHGASWTENGWEGLSAVRWVMLVTIVVAIGSPVLRFSQRDRGSAPNASGLILALGALTSVLLIYRVLIDLPSSSAVPDQKLGALLGLASALGITLGGWESVSAVRAALATRRRRS